MDALKISPRYTSLDWQELNVNNPEDWPKAADIVRDRLDGRFLRFATSWLSDQHSGFVVLAIDSLLTETIQQFEEGVHKSERFGRTFMRALEGPRFQPYFDENARTDFYKDIRCGLLHQAEAKNKWLIRRKQTGLLRRVGDGYIVDVEQFHAAVQGTLNDYLKQLSEPANSELRSKLWKKMDRICSVRAARGLLYEAEADSASTQSSHRQPGEKP